jgi:hypothetical protein
MMFHSPRRRVRETLLGSGTSGTATENLHHVDRNFDAVAREAVLPIPFAAPQPPFDVGQLAAA